jgi:hypothetical protein
MGVNAIHDEIFSRENVGLKRELQGLQAERRQKGGLRSAAF